MARDIEEVEPLAPIATTSSSNNPNIKVRAKPDPVLSTCRCFSFVTVIASILCIIANVISAVKSFTNGLDVRFDLFYISILNILTFRYDVMFYFLFVDI